MAEASLGSLDRFSSYIKSKSHHDDYYSVYHSFIIRLSFITTNFPFISFLTLIMKISQFLCSASIAALIDHALAYPSMGAKIGEILRLAKRDNPVGTNIALGDLVGGARTTTGTTITQCLANTIDCYLTTNKVSPAP
jgi:hypothetical protein